MHYQLEKELNLPAEKAYELLIDQSKYPRWMPTLKSVEPIEGEPGKVGYKSILTFDDNGKVMSMVESLTAIEPPLSFRVTYEGGPVWNQIENRFVVLDEKRTKWEFDCEFRFRGFMKVMAFFAKGMFVKESEKNLERFREFAEAEHAS